MIRMADKYYLILISYLQVEQVYPFFALDFSLTSSASKFSHSA